jgi:hypothetical protein
MLFKSQVVILKTMVSKSNLYKRNELLVNQIGGLIAPRTLEKFENLGFITREKRLHRPYDKQEKWFITITDVAKEYVDKL